MVEVSASTTTGGLGVSPDSGPAAAAAILVGLAMTLASAAVTVLLRTSSTQEEDAN
jgi:hypothetical protein